MSDSRIPGFYRMELAQRIDALAECGLDCEIVPGISSALAGPLAVGFMALLEEFVLTWDPARSGRPRHRVLDVRDDALVL